VAEVTGYTPIWVSKILWRYNDHGLAGLGDGRLDNAGAGPDKHIILVLDGAGWHVARDLEVPEKVELMFLPPYSPQIQPAERLWPLTNEPIVNQYFETLDELDEVLAERCRILVEDQDQIRAHTLFEWWPQYN
jgi:transposase